MQPDGHRTLILPPRSRRQSQRTSIQSSLTGPPTLPNDQAFSLDTLNLKPLSTHSPACVCTILPNHDLHKHVRGVLPVLAACNHLENTL